jgi:hypothetical protein
MLGPADAATPYSTSVITGADYPKGLAGEVGDGSQKGFTQAFTNAAIPIQMGPVR